MYSGGFYWPLDPDPADVSVVDIAYHLGRKCRFSGAIRRFYSVAEHCVLLSQAVPPELAWEALHHDDAEAVLADIVTPVKRLMPDVWHRVEALNEEAISVRAFGCDPARMEALKPWDRAAAFDEASVLCDLLPGHDRWWEGRTKGVVSPECWGPEEAPLRFLERHRELRALGLGRDAPRDLVLSCVPDTDWEVPGLTPAAR